MKATVLKLKSKIQDLKLRKYFHSLWDEESFILSKWFGQEHSLPVGAILHILKGRNNTSGIPGTSASYKTGRRWKENENRHGILFLPTHKESSQWWVYGVSLNNSSSFSVCLKKIFFLFEIFYYEVLKGEKRHQDIWPRFCLGEHAVGIS